MRVRLAFFVIFILMSSCASFGNKQVANEEILSKIKVGQSTKNDCKALLGEPFNVMFSDNGEETWMYMYTRSSVRAASFIPVAGIFAGGADTNMHSLTIRFDKDGVVKQIGKGGAKGGGGSVLD